MGDQPPARVSRWVSVITWTTVGPVLAVLLLWGAMLDIVDPNPWVFPGRQSSPVAVGLATAAVVPMLVRRRWPLGCLAVSAAATTILALFDYAAYFPSLAVSVILATVLRRCSPKAYIVGVVMTGIALATATAQRPAEYIGTEIPVFALVTIAGIAARWFDRRTAARVAAQEPATAL